MGSYSDIELDIKAKAAILGLVRNIDTGNIIDDICSSYKEFCDSVDARRVAHKYRKITGGAPLRVFFETLCFAAFLTTQKVEDYVTIRKLFRRRTDHGSADYFNSRFATHLHGQGQKMRMNKLHEIVLLSPAPDIRIGSGEPLDTVKRLTEYLACHEEDLEAAKQHFRICLGKAFDPYSYHILMGLWGTYERTLDTIADKVMAGVFRSQVKLAKRSAF